jgi:hypothetical protein
MFSLEFVLICQLVASFQYSTKSLFHSIDLSFTDSKLISYWGTFSFFVVVSLMKSVKNKETTFLCCKSTADAPI